MITSNGYQEGAKLEAKFYGIELITTEDLPNIYPLTLTHAKWLLPDENTYGDPFWTIMEVNENGKKRVHVIHQIIDSIISIEKVC